MNLGTFLQSFTIQLPSAAYTYLLEGVTTAIPLLTIEQLIDHPFVKPNEFKKSIASQKDFKLTDFKFVKELGTGAYGRCDLVNYLPSQEQVVLKSTTNTKS